MKIIENLTPYQIEWLTNWCREETKNLTGSYLRSSYVVGDRREKQYGWGINLNSDEVYEYPVNKVIKRIGDRYFPGWNSCLLLYYKPRAGILLHRDHKSTEAKVVEINLGCPVLLSVDSKDHWFEIGEVVEFNSKKLHSAGKCLTERWVVSFRKVKQNYLNKQLDLF